MSETRHEAFQRLLAIRMPKATTALRTIAQLGTGRYEWTEAEAQAFVFALQKQMDAIRLAFGVHDADAPPAAPEPPKRATSGNVKATYDGLVLTNLKAARKRASWDDIRAALDWMEKRDA